MSPYQQSVGIDTVRGAGNERTVIFPFFNPKGTRLLGFRNQDLIDLIGQHVVQDPEHKDVSRLQLVQVGE